MAWVAFTEEQRIDAFVAKCDVVQSGCVEWTATKHRQGYGMFGAGGKSNMVLAHRFAYETFVGPVPEGLELDHLCRNPACVNPDHLEPVTHSENLRRVPNQRTHCGRGHEFTPENTRLVQRNRGGNRQPYVERVCRACLRSRADRSVAAQSERG